MTTAAAAVPSAGARVPSDVSVTLSMRRQTNRPVRRMKSSLVAAEAEKISKRYRKRAAPYRELAGRESPVPSSVSDPSDIDDASEVAQTGAVLSLDRVPP